MFYYHIDDQFPNIFMRPLHVGYVLNSLHVINLSVDLVIFHGFSKNDFSVHCNLILV